MDYKGLLEFFRINLLKDDIVYCGLNVIILKKVIRFYFMEYILFIKITLYYNIYINIIINFLKNGIKKV